MCKELQKRSVSSFQRGAELVLRDNIAEVYLGVYVLIALINIEKQQQPVFTVEYKYNVGLSNQVLFNPDRCPANATLETLPKTLSRTIYAEICSLYSEDTPPDSTANWTLWRKTAVGYPF